MELGDLSLSRREFLRIKRRLHQLSGISLSNAKETHVVARLAKHLRRLEITSFDAYVDRLESADQDDEQQAFVNALTTNLTRFWREEHHFAHLLEHLPPLLERRRRKARLGAPRLRIWSAGCSTGQEAYTIAMALLEAHPELGGWDFRILATDIDTGVIEKAKEGVFTDSEVHGLSPKRLQHFEAIGGGRVRVPDAVRRTIVFKPLNLLGPWPMRGLFDVIFCRNVAIYFDRSTQIDMFDRLGTVLAPDGYLYIGHSENIAASSRFKLIGKTAYQLREADEQSAA